MKKLITFLLLLLIVATVSAQNYKGFELWATKTLRSDNNFYWKGDYIQKDSLVYVEFSAAKDSVRFHYINGPWSPWYKANGGSGSMVYPAAGIAVSNGSGWATSLTDNSATWNKAIYSDATFSAANYLLKTADTGRKAVASGIYEDDATGRVDFAKNIKLVATTYNSGSPYGVIYKDGNPFIHDFNYGFNGTVTTDGANVFIGRNSGNFTLGSTATASYNSSYNVGIGYNTLVSLTTGSYNLALGLNALRFCTSGNYNNGFGSNALRNVTFGVENFGFGSNALYSLTSGNYNIAMGNSALYHALGSYNLAIGFNAGRYLANGTSQNTTSDYSIYIGPSTKSYVDDSQNEIVVGYNAIGNGSNTATWGNTSITNHYFTGKIRANTALISTNAAAGRMLYSSDAAGNLSYTNTPADGQVMKYTGGVPTWSAESAMVYPGAGLAKSTGSGWATSITDNSSNWNTAYGWGNHASQGYVNSILINGTSGENAGGFLDFIPGSGINITKTDGHVTIAATGGGTGTVTSVGLSAPTGFSVSGSPITTSGTLALSFAAGYSLPSDATQALWTTAYNNRIATFTTTGNSGAATFSGNVLNIPNYTLAGLGGQPTVGANVSFGYNGNWVALDGSLVRYSNTILQRFADIGGGTYVGSTFPAASTTEAGLMSATDKTNLDAAVSNSGKVKLFGTSTWGELSANYFEWSTNSFRPIRDGSPQENSLYPITSGGVYTALLAKANLSGATFTGAISGTSATFSSTVTASDFQLSDRRLKTDIRRLKNIDWADRIDFVSYRMKADSSQRLRYGVIAQDVEKYAPELVNTDENGTKSVSYIDLLIVKNQQLQNQINFQRYEILFSICLSCFLFVVVILRGSKRT